MSYHIYRYGDGCLWMEDMAKAVDHFKNLPMDQQYSAIGISEDGYAVDVIIKGEYAGKGQLLCSRDIKQSILFQEYPEKTIETLKALYEAVGVKEEHATEIIDELTRMVEELDDLEEM
jgi:hypothetical protein